MKKAMCLITVFLLAISLCACGGEVNTADPNTKEAYIGQWTHEKTDAEPYTMNLEFYADGTGKSGKNSGLKWSYDEAANEITIVLIYPDGSESDGATAKIQADGSMLWNYEMKVITSDDQTLTFPNVTLKRK